METNKSQGPPRVSRAPAKNPSSQTDPLKKVSRDGDGDIGQRLGELDFARALSGLHYQRCGGGRRVIRKKLSP